MKAVTSIINFLNIAGGIVAFFGMIYNAKLRSETTTLMDRRYYSINIMIWLVVFLVNALAAIITAD